jgi:CDP-glycerol glycerophosphotransferase (TagB/SpsB family)
MVKPHDHPKKKVDWFSELAPLEDERVRLVRGLDVIPFLSAADLLITDASSVAFEYTLLDRPIVFLDVPKLFRQIEKRAPAADLATYGRRIGKVAATAEELTQTIAESLTSSGREADLRRAAAEHIFHAPGGASARVAAVVRYAADIEPSLPEAVEVVAPGEAA